eukprot:762921-Hanusia_phi.AAC.3
MSLSTERTPQMARSSASTGLLASAAAALAASARCRQAEAEALGKPPPASLSACWIAASSSSLRSPRLADHSTPGRGAARAGPAAFAARALALDAWAGARASISESASSSMASSCGPSATTSMSSIRCSAMVTLCSICRLS